MLQTALTKLTITNTRQGLLVQILTTYSQIIVFIHSFTLQDADKTDHFHAVGLPLRGMLRSLPEKRSKVC